MTVVGLVRDKSFVAKLRKIYPAYALKPTTELLLPARHDEPSYIGLAFDYLYRIALARDHGFAAPHLRWEADWAPACISPDDNNVMTRVFYGQQMDRSYTVRRDGIGLKRHLWSLRVLLEAKTAAAQFHHDGKLTDDLVWTMFKVGYLEMVMRAGKAEAIDPDALDLPNQRAIDELKGLLDLARSQRLNAANCLYLDPGLRAQRLAGGASPDLFADGWFCDLKVVTRLGDAARWADQLVLYAALCALGGLDLSRTDGWTGARDSSSSKHATLAALMDVNPQELPAGRMQVDRWPRIEGIAAYFARHGQWVVVPRSRLLNTVQFEAVKSLLCAQYLGTSAPAKIKALRRALNFRGPSI
jgi:hypothetical protein